MADNRNICEEIEIAIYSGTELTDEQKNHIENCEECRALLTQMTQLGNDLNALAVPGIREGEIADRVMENIKQQKLSKPFPKFKVTHHLGTAAAVAVILVAALIIKNPAETDSNKLSANDFDGAGIIVSSPEDAVFGTAYNDNGDEAENNGSEVQMLARSENGTEVLSDTSDTEEETVPESVEQPKFMMARPATEKTESASSDYDAATNDSYFSSDITDSDNVWVVYKDTADEVTVEFDGYAYSSGDDTSTQSFNSAEKSSENQKGSSAGAGGSYVSEYSTEQEIHNEWRLMLPALPDGMVTAFDGIEFLHGEENFDYNIQLANTRLYELYGKEHYLTREVLSACGCTYNAQFLIFVNDGISYDE